LHIANICAATPANATLALALESILRDGVLGGKNLRRGPRRRENAAFSSPAQQASGFLEHPFRAQRRRAGDDQSEPRGGLEVSTKLFEIIALSRPAKL
jgi:hypothetical protein